MEGSKGAVKVQPEADRVRLRREEGDDRAPSLRAPGQATCAWAARLTGPREGGARLAQEGGRWRVGWWAGWARARRREILTHERKRIFFLFSSFRNLGSLNSTRFKFKRDSNKL